MRPLLFHVQMYRICTQNLKIANITFYYALYMYHVFVYFVLFFAFLFQDLKVGAEAKTEL